MPVGLDYSAAVCNLQNLGHIQVSKAWWDMLAGMSRDLWMADACAVAQRVYEHTSLAAERKAMHKWRRLQCSKSRAWHPSKTAAKRHKTRGPDSAS
jgi:hypothetical protein